MQVYTYKVLFILLTSLHSKYNILKRMHYINMIMLTNDHIFCYRAHNREERGRTTQTNFKNQ
uniref:Uncharacterized protein n=1 Tax=Arundo donax TaxID=35708 RepID=A0A0A9F3C7_ARUDO